MVMEDRLGDTVGDEAITTPAADGSFELLSVFYPMWNEQEYIERALDYGHRACTALIERGDIADYELIVIDDASDDATGAIADRCAAENSRVRVVHHATNRKLGGSMRSGFAAARGDLVLYTDADLPFDMAELPRIVRLMRDYDADIVSAYRFDRTGEGALRAVYTFVYNALVKAVFGVRLRDINFACKLVRRRVLDAVDLRSEGSFIDAELMIRAKRSGFEIVQMGVDYFPRTRGISTLSSPGVIFTILSEMWTLRRDLIGVQPVVSARSDGDGGDR